MTAPMGSGTHLGSNSANHLWKARYRFQRSFFSLLISAADTGMLILIRHSPEQHEQTTPTKLTATSTPLTAPDGSVLIQHSVLDSEPKAPWCLCQVLLAPALSCLLRRRSHFGHITCWAKQILKHMEQPADNSALVKLMESSSKFSTHVLYSSLKKSKLQIMNSV